MDQSYNEAFDPAKTVERDIISYRSFLLKVKNASAATINRRLASLSKFFAWCVATKKCTLNPSEGVKSIAISDAGPKSLSATELNRLLREVHREQNRKDIASIELLCGTGMRVSELAALTLDDITLSERKGSVRIRSGKGMSSREVPLNADVRKAVREYLDVRPASTTKFLILSQHGGGGMTANGIWRLVKKYAQKTGLEIRAHDLRHTVITRLVREFNCDLITVSRISGHRSLKQLQRYAAPNMKDMETALDKLSSEYE
jgi:site-specific recombinase XerD